MAACCSGVGCDGIGGLGTPPGGPGGLKGPPCILIKLSQDQLLLCFHEQEERVMDALCFAHCCPNAGSVSIASIIANANKMNSVCGRHTDRTARESWAVTLSLLYPVLLLTLRVGCVAVWTQGIGQEATC